MSALWGTYYQARGEQEAEQIQKGLSIYGDKIPSGFKPGRIPTPQEMQLAIESINGAETEYFISDDNWQADVTFGELSILVSDVDFKGDENAPITFYYQGDPELITLILKRLAPYCGAFILQNDLEPDEITVILPEITDTSQEQ